LESCLHQFCCVPDKEELDVRAKLLAGLTGKEGGAAVIAGMLVATFGASPAVAAIVAALLLKIVVAPALDEVCQAWRKSLGDRGRVESKPS
jgi:hypothetical protein